MHEPTPPGRGHEKRDINIRLVALIGGGLLVVIAVIGHVAPWFVFQQLEGITGSETDEVSPLFEQNRIPPSPRLQAAPWADLQRLREHEDRELNSYGWVDQANGVVRIPIERAMSMLVERGLPARPDTEAVGGAGSQSPGAQPAPAHERPAAPGGAPPRNPTPRKSP